jgi:hypothetical protein
MSNRPPVFPHEIGVGVGTPTPYSAPHFLLSHVFSTTERTEHTEEPKGSPPCPLWVNNATSGDV